MFVHYTAIAAVQGGPRGFRSLLEVRLLPETHGKLMLTFSLAGRTGNALVTFSSVGSRLTLSSSQVEYTIAQGPKGWQAQDVTGPNGALVAQPAVLGARLTLGMQVLPASARRPEAPRRRSCRLVQPRPIVVDDPFSM